MEQAPRHHQNLELANTLFPPPPDCYKAFTDANLSRYGQLRGEPSGTNKGKSAARHVQTLDIGHDHSGGSSRVALTPDEAAELENLQFQLTRPRADWVEEEGQWQCFGQQYSTSLAIPTARDIGLPPLIDENESPHTSLPPILHSFLHTLLLLLDALTRTARIPGELEERGWAHEGDQYIQHLTNLAATMVVSANQLRGVQAEATLVMLMEKQLDVRRNQTAALRSKCHMISKSIAALKTAAGGALESAHG